MAKKYNNILDTIGHTPLVKLNQFCEALHVGKNIYVKLEGTNPGGSLKVRAALSCIEKAERSGKLKKEGGLVIEAASFNTAVGLAVVCAAKNHKLVIVMPNTESKERRSLLHSYGVQIVLTDGKLGIKGAEKRADELCRSNPDAFRPRFFYNHDVISGYKKIASEIWHDTAGEVDIVVAGVGSGATITSIGEYIKRKKKSVEIVAVEAEEAQVLLDDEKDPMPHGICGLGKGEMPPLINTKLIDEVYPVSSANAYGACVAIASNDGILAGISSGAALYAAAQIARMPQNADKTIVVVLAETGERYLGTGLFDWNESYIVVN